ncbi:hypothetical protein [Rhizobium leguminosarum]|uniref:hypothetical protein n=1 Tax=Rhizobium leguminosarum TaxID=384 RepID=UPI00103256CF|nr:hypothetical protein [Rhizobium leguminosarum]TBH09915.1 hypothetical protein ELG68_01395 [Rhizobium leguminosarum]
MLNLNEAAARRIVDAIAIAIDGKPSSAKTFSAAPFTELTDFTSWGQQNNDSNNDTKRTDALTVAYLLFSGGRIPLSGIEMHGTYFRPDKWIIGALVKKGRAEPDASGKNILFTQTGWEWMAGILEGLAKA